jgi:hypothetical protein
MSLLSSRNQALTALPSRITWRAKEGWVTEIGFVGDTELIRSIASAYSLSNFVEVDVNELEGGVSELRARTPTATNPDENPDNIAETPEIEWELLANDEQEDIKTSANARAIEVANAGMLAFVDKQIDALKEDLEQQTTASEVNVYVTEMSNNMAAISSAVQQYFLLRLRGVDSYTFSRWYIRKNVAISSISASIAASIVSGTLSNVDRYFTTAQLVAAETTIPTAISASLPSGGYWIKHTPVIRSNAQGRLTVSVEYYYTLDLSTFLYSAAS